MNSESTIDRRQWMATLARAPREVLERLWSDIDDPPTFTILKPAETGLVMVRARCGGGGAPFNFGEMTMTRCIVQTSGRIQGHAYVAGRDRRQAELAARFDALLQMPERAASLFDGVVVPLARAQAERRERRWADAAATRVDFLTMVRGA
jgi:alpha-D-ribose 1-methylphosphonate 5-triphosphate synthase subunit PhnG